MNLITDQTFDEERSLYGSKDLIIRDCKFDGPADGESALKESRNIEVDHCCFNLRYPLWHDVGLKMTDSEMTQQCRAALWYTKQAQITDCRLHGIKALRECSEIKMRGCDVISPEFGWFVHEITIEDTNVTGEYFMMRSDHLDFKNVQLKGKYSFQYIKDSVFENCVFDTKDAFWHARNVLVKNCVVKGEYLAWYSENITFENCKIIGTQPLCYCRGLRLIDCEMTDTDLCFERSEVEAYITTPVISIKNPISGHIYVPAAGEVIRDIEEAKGEIVIME